MFKKKINLKVSWETLRVFITLTVVFTLIGFLFGRVLENVFLDSSTPTANVVEGAGTYPDDGSEIDQTGEDPIEDSASEVKSENTFFVMQVGAFETLDNALAMVGRLESMGIPCGVNRINGRHYVFSHIVSDRGQLADPEEVLRQNGIEPFIRSVEADTDDLRWYYFLKAVQQIPFEMQSDFISQFTNDELHIFGLYVVLSSTAFEPLSNERQEILLDIYNWLMS